jgi:hypothetical protein
MGTGVNSLASVLLVVTALSPAWADDATKVTYTKDIAPIMNAHCVVCHRGGEVAPMSLTTYAEVRPWAKAISKRVVQERSMPPWHADPAYGTFSNDKRLSAEQIATIDRWIKTGTPLGDLADMPAPREFPDGWVLGEPDYVLELDAVDVPADGPDKFPNLKAKLDLGEDRWIRAIEIQPSQKRAVHHVFARVAEPDGKIGGQLGAYVAGSGPTVFEDGTGRLIKKDQEIVAQAHYHAFGTPVTDKTRIGLYFANGDIEHESVALAISNTTFKIPPGAKDYEVTASYTFDQYALITNLGPHMHQRGKDMTITAVFPDGNSETLVKSNWNPDWDISYKLAKPIVAPKGTKLELVAHYDNSADNPRNPDPSDELTFGVDEMMIGFIDYLVERDSSAGQE